MSLHITANTVAPPSYSKQRQCCCCLVEINGHLIEVFWRGTGHMKHIDAEAILAIQPLVQSEAFTEMMNNSQHIMAGQEGMIRKSAAAHSLPIYKVVRPDDSERRHTIQREHDLMVYLQTQGAPVVAVSSTPCIDEQGVFGFAMAELLMPSPAELLSRLDELATMINELHRLGVVHGDVSASNIMKDEKGTLQFIDFGFAGKLGEELPETHIQKVHYGQTHFVQQIDLLGLDRVKMQLKAMMQPFNPANKQAGTDT